MFAAVEKKDEVIPVISYWNDGTLGVLSDKNIYGIGAKDGQEEWKYELERRVQIAYRKHPVIVRNIGRKRINANAFLYTLLQQVSLCIVSGLYEGRRKILCGYGRPEMERHI